MLWVALEKKSVAFIALAYALACRHMCVYTQILNHQYHKYIIFDRKLPIINL